MKKNLSVAIHHNRKTIKPFIYLEEVYTGTSITQYSLFVKIFSDNSEIKLLSAPAGLGTLSQDSVTRIFEIKIEEDTSSSIRNVIDYSVDIPVTAIIAPECEVYVILDVKDHLGAAKVNHDGSSVGRYSDAD
ncbi:hypothetical protein QQ020_14180 [Fulvivirgaceae bacterium BMA12]|uniref:Exosporium protein C n=1 Tax=Agaribacillus aureus TaxID=3051825 RepID=A0ABT8L893_9BACT|nr:hypothetical protein [Fulvivirgaceae bacterium BMA12]